MIKNVPVRVAAIALGKCEQNIRIGLQRERYKFGTAVQAEGGKKWTYHISPRLFCDYTGLDMAELESMAEVDHEE